MADEFRATRDRSFELRPDEQGFRYVLMWMSYLMEKGYDADLSYVHEWHDFVKQCRDAVLNTQPSAAAPTFDEARMAVAAGEVLTRHDDKSLKAAAFRIIGAICDEHDDCSQDILQLARHALSTLAPSATVAPRFEDVIDPNGRHAWEARRFELLERLQRLAKYLFDRGADADCQTVREAAHQLSFGQHATTSTKSDHG